MTEPENQFGKTCRNSIIFCGTILAAALVISAVLPTSQTATEIPAVLASLGSEPEEEVTASFGMIAEEVSFGIPKVVSADSALSLFRHPSSRAAVEWFYLHVTGSRDISVAILEEAEKNDIPLSLAFALAYTESRYNVKAINKNKNSSIDRGLFQLNNRSFPQLEEEDFFNPAVSAKYGMSHLRYCMNVAGNEVTALAMYNAGTNKVRSDKTPHTTLNYVGKIMRYREQLDKLFAEEVLVYYETSKPLAGIAVAYTGSRR